jgi:succinate dehydrogenase/fumarate reductase flavoprotein subunit
MTDTEFDVDVLVVGSGAAGLVAALTAVENGATRVLVAEAEGVVGGSSRLSGGLIMGAGTRYQAAAGIVDSPAELIQDYMQVNRWTVDAAIVRRFCETTGAVVDWLGDLGVEYHSQLIKAGDERTPRVHMPVGSGQAVVDVLHRRCREAGVDIALGQRVDRLLTDDITGAVRGVAVGDDQITAGAVVIATGGFGNSPQKLAEHFPSAAATEWTWYIGADGSRGDAIELGRQVDAQLVGHDHGLRLLHVDFDRDYEAMLPGWLVMVDASGHRFVDETAPYGVLDSVSREHGDRVFVVFDATSLARTSEWGSAQFAYPIPGHERALSKHWNPDLVEQMVRAGAVCSSDTLAGLAAALGIDEVGLSGTLARYNAFTADGVDRQCGKAARFLHPVQTAPFYGAELRPATVCSTAYGLRITPDAEVLAVDDRLIGGLFAAGECTGNVVGRNYFGSGNNYANCCAVGRIAGEAAARHAAQHATQKAGVS